MSNRICETKEHGSSMSDAGSRTAARRRGISYLKLLQSQWWLNLVKEGCFDAHDAGGEALDQKVLRRRTPLTGFDVEPAADLEAAQAVLCDRRELVMQKLHDDVFASTRISVGQYDRKELRRLVCKQPAKIRLKDRADFFPGSAGLPRSSSFFACLCQQVLEDNPFLVKLFRLASGSAAFYCVKRRMLQQISNAYPSLLDMSNEHLDYASSALHSFLMGCGFKSELMHLLEFKGGRLCIEVYEKPWLRVLMLNDVEGPVADEAMVFSPTTHEPKCSDRRGHLWKGPSKAVWKSEELATASHRGEYHIVPDPDGEEYCVRCGCGRIRPIYTPGLYAFLVAYAANHGIDEREIMGEKDEHRTARKRAAKRATSKT
jgi:hypothetical protein